MTLYQYKMLSEDEQYEVVFAKGKFLDIYLDGKTKYVLYALVSLNNTNMNLRDCSPNDS